MWIEQAYSTVLYKCICQNKQRNREFHSKDGECKTGDHGLDHRCGGTFQPSTDGEEGGLPAKNSFVFVWAELLQVNYERNIQSGLQVSLQTGTAR